MSRWGILRWTLASLELWRSKSESGDLARSPQGEGWFQDTTGVNLQGSMTFNGYVFDAEQAQGRSDFILAGVDEVGRGPMAGPVVAAAVIFKPGAPQIEVRDSKMLSASRREALYREILRHCDWGLGVMPESVIDEVNIYQATRLAMRQAVQALPKTPHLILIDGPMRLDLPHAQEPVIKGDQKSAVIAAASVLAKVYRDHWMEGLDQIFQGYGFAKHKGYPTELHRKQLKMLGPSLVHRKSFAPVRECLEAQP